MSKKRIRATMYYGHGRPWFKQPVRDAEQNAFYVLPATAEAYEQMVEQMVKALSAKWTGTYTGDVGIVLRAIGITPPARQARKGLQKGQP